MVHTWDSAENFSILYMSFTHRTSTLLLFRLADGP